ncbi:uncharacterized protein KY384_003179 [Bacidia gigantensis]|uniref:uncharacterized protein n=1 Tax=Bacidia gigantensis TaxID=2732470 RepID=UPI001D047126|nr:uncharacterized protein KY384_003179 [Bacidia gigantensis]KAG8531549.1 hypothetical protein KY384_003179 [Bacidia gigantensis]
MKAIRRSLKGEKDTRPLHTSIPAKSAIAIQPPKKWSPRQVIKAKYDYNPNPEHTQGLAFSKGDFFHVISREDDTEWYEACNPISGSRGLVPVSYFEHVFKTERQSGGSVQSAASNAMPAQMDQPQSEKAGSGQPSSGSVGRKSGQQIRLSALGKSTGAMVYGVVMYDFKAERPDELAAEAGESIIIIAQSNPEWFVAKPIKRLGGPGLIPVTFIEIRDMNTGDAVVDPHEAVQRAGVPKVEEWKRLAANYKNSSIPLGKISDGGLSSTQNGMDRMSLSSQHTPGTNGGFHQRQPSRNMQNNHDRQSQRLNLAPTSATIPRYIFENDKYWYIIECQMEDGRWWELSRTYQKFYDFQIALLQQFPKEAQTPPGGKRVLPFMPGPVTYVTDAISNGRRESLNTYVKELLALAPYISRCDLVRELFNPGDGDYELDPDRVQENFRHSGESQSDMTGELSRTASRQSSQGRMNGGANGGPTASMNGYGNMGPPPQKAAQPNGQQPGHYRDASDMSYHHPGHQQQDIRPQPSNLTQASSTHSSALNASSTSINNPAHSSSNNNASNSGGATGTGSAMKIKVNFQDETIVIRVPSDISFSALRDKCKDRLKISEREEVMLSYRDEPTGGNYEMLSDRDLDMALNRNQRLLLTVAFV